MNALFTKDAPSKKRKKWSDGQFSIDRATRRVRLTDAGGQHLYAGVVDEATLAKIESQDEVKLGCVMVMLQETLTDAQSIPTTTTVQRPTIVQRPALAALSAAAARAPLLNSNRPLSSQFKPPMVRSVAGTASTVNTNTKISSCSSSSSSSSSSGDNLHNDEAVGIAEQPQPSSTGLILPPTVPRTSLHPLLARRPMPSLTKTKASLQLCRLYDRVPRKCEIDVQFREPSMYAEQFQAALYEELSLSLAGPMSMYETKVSQALRLPTENSSASSTTTTTTNNNNNSNNNNNNNNSSSKCPSIDTITERLRKQGGIPFISNVEVIVSPPKTQREKDNAARYQQGEQGNKRSKRRIDDDDDDDEPSTAAASPYQDRPNLFMKCQGGQRGCPTACEGTNYTHYT